MRGLHKYHLFTIADGHVALERKRGKVFLRYLPESGICGLLSFETGEA
jgi:hypothetical protein